MLVTTRPVPRPVENLALAELREALLSPLPTLPSKYFYDERGSRLFEEITRQPEYYLTRAESALFERGGFALFASERPQELLELGSGSGEKLRRLLELFDAGGSGRRCVVFDVDAAAVRRSVAELQERFLRLELVGIVGDFLHDIDRVSLAAGRRMVLLLGSTLGNLHPAQVPGFLRSVANVSAPGDTFLIGLDLEKDKARLEAAYNDAAGLTAEFNRNILRVVNARFGTDFDPAGFDHVAFYDTEERWIEMRLRARRPMRVSLKPVKLTLSLERGDDIRTELSCKYTRERFSALVRGTGYALKAWLGGAGGDFALALLERTGWRD
jgi:L-histidine N-alpha-methyltransferase